MAPQSRRGSPCTARLWAPHLSRTGKIGPSRAGPSLAILDLSRPQKSKLTSHLVAVEDLIFRDRSPERNNKCSTIGEGGGTTPSFVAAIYLKLSISTDATRFPPTQPGAVALA